MPSKNVHVTIIHIKISLYILQIEQNILYLGENVDHTDFWNYFPSQVLTEFQFRSLPLYDI